MASLTALRNNATARWSKRIRDLENYPTGCHNLDIEAPCPGVVIWHNSLGMYWRLRRDYQRAVRQWATAGVQCAAENNRADLRNCTRTIRETILPNLRKAYEAERMRQRPLMAAE